MSNKTWIPSGVSEDIWTSFVMDAKQSITSWLDSRGLTISIWNDLCSEDLLSWNNIDADDWKDSFAYYVIDAIDAEFIDKTILDSFKETAKLEGRWSDDSDDDEINYACAEAAWNEAIWAAEDIISNESI